MRSGPPRPLICAEQMAFFLRHGSGIVCAQMSDERANQLGLPVDSRDYGIGAAILVGLGVRRLRLITNNPHKYGGLSGYDLDLVGRVRTPAAVTAHNIAYLRTKQDRMGHDLDLPVQLARAT